MNREPRTLYYVPIIHTSADMGSLAKALNSCGISQVGERMWQEHIAAVNRFWDTIAQFAATLAAPGLKIYQDGLVADGEIGLKIVAAGVQSGSRNYQIVEMLIKRGAEIVKTEDFKLVLEERDRILEVVDAPTRWAKAFASLKYRFIKHWLLNRRDSFIARRIDETLGTTSSRGASVPGISGHLPLCGDVEGGLAPHSPDLSDPGFAEARSRDGRGTGILFIGAYHRVREKLPKDIKVIEIKEVEKVRQYQKLLPFCNNHRREFIGLSHYLEAPVKQQLVLVPPSRPETARSGEMNTTELELVCRSPM